MKIRFTLSRTGMGSGTDPTVMCPSPESKIQSCHYRRGGDTDDLLMTRATTTFQLKSGHTDYEE
jgi:hypothetical protein